MTRHAAAVSLVPFSAVLSDACEWEQLRCCYQYQIWCCLSSWIYVVILASLKKKFPLVYFAILSDSEVYFLSPNLPPRSVSSPSPPDCFNSHVSHLIWSLVSSSPVSEEEIMHVSGFPFQGWEQPTGFLSFSWIAAYWRGRIFPKLEIQGWIQLLSHAFSVPFEHFCDILPGLHQLYRRPGSPIHPVLCLLTLFQSLRYVRMIQMVLRMKVCLTESHPWYNVWCLIKAYLCQAVSRFFFSPFFSSLT